MKRKINYRKLIPTLLVIIVVVIGIIVSFKGNKTILSKEEDESQKEDISETQNNRETSEEEGGEETNDEENNDVDKNHLSDTESSFGTLDVPVYKIGEKDIKIPIIIYHAFSTPIPESDPYKLFSSRERFDENVTTLLEAGYTFITLDDIYKYNEGKIALPEKNVAITMDDGWYGNYTDAFPVLKEHNIPATIFVVEELIGTEGYFSWDQAKEMYDTGLVKIHSHGQKHIDYSKLSKEALIAGIEHSQEAIEKALGEKVSKIFAYPSGAYTENSVNWLKEAGYHVQVLTKYGTVNKSASLDLTALGRIRGEQATGASLLKTIENASVK